MIRLIDRSARNLKVFLSNGDIRADAIPNLVHCLKRGPTLDHCSRSSRAVSNDLRITWLRSADPSTAANIIALVYYQCGVEWNLLLTGLEISRYPLEISEKFTIGQIA